MGKVAKRTRSNECLSFVEGRKCNSFLEKRFEKNPDQLLFFVNTQTPIPEDQPKQKITFERGKFKKQRGDDCVNEEGQRFSSEITVLSNAPMVT